MTSCGTRLQPAHHLREHHPRASFRRRHLLQRAPANSPAGYIRLAARTFSDAARALGDRGLAAQQVGTSNSRDSAARPRGLRPSRHVSKRLRSRNLCDRMKTTPAALWESTNRPADTISGLPQGSRCRLGRAGPADLLSRVGLLEAGGGTSGSKAQHNDDAYITKIGGSGALVVSSRTPPVSADGNRDRAGGLRKRRTHGVRRFRTRPVSLLACATQPHTLPRLGRATY